MQDQKNMKGAYELTKLCKLIRHIYMPMEKGNQNIRTMLQNYSNTLKESVDQVTKSRDIKIPDFIEPNESKALSTNSTIEEYRSYLEKWCMVIKSKIKLEQNKRTNFRQAYQIIEYWRSRASSLSTLYQDLNKPAVLKIRDRYKKFTEINNLHGDDMVLKELDEQMKKLIQMNAEAKDNDKFLNTLERQFNILQSHDLATIEQCLPSLFNGLRLVFIISRHYKDSKKMTELLETIAKQICDRVSSTVKIRDLLKPRENIMYEKQLEEAIKKIEQAQKVLSAWVKNYRETKNNLENESLTDRWEFNKKIITKMPNDMNSILSNFLSIAQLLKKLLVLLGPKLKAVTGNTDEIDNLIVVVKGLVKHFEDFDEKIFEENNLDTWKSAYNKFNSESAEIQTRASKLIDTTFSVLRSSQSGFEFLQKFKNLDTLEQISSEQKNRYMKVLDSYKKEVEENKMLFSFGDLTQAEKESLGWEENDSLMKDDESQAKAKKKKKKARKTSKKEKNIDLKGKALKKRGMDNYLITKNKPPIAGLISWKFTIFQRAKVPIRKFLTKEDVFEKDKLETIKSEHWSFMRKLDTYQDTLFEYWENEVNEQAKTFLEEKILRVDENGNFSVNFLAQFRVLIAEAKYLDKLETKVSKKILNIALQEEGYYRYVDKLNKMLREYNTTINSLKDVEKDLMGEYIEKLRDTLLPGTSSYNLNSLGIEHFIQTCMKEISLFQDKKTKVEEKTRNIEDIIKTIERANILRDFNFKKFHKDQTKSDKYLTLHDFIAYFDKYMRTEVKNLSDKYIRIGETMLPQITNAIFDNAVFQSSSNGDRKVEQMRPYYYYWERRVYNGLIKMIIRALLKFKAILSRKKKKSIPLFKIQTDFVNPKVNTNPNFKEISNTIQKFVDNVIDSSANFSRWCDGTCICVDEYTMMDDKTETATVGGKETKAFNFDTDVNKNNVIKGLVTDIEVIKQDALTRLKTSKSIWEINKSQEGHENNLERYKIGLWDPKHRSKIEKELEKNLSTSRIEYNLDMFEMIMKEYNENLDEMDVDFIRIDFRRVKTAFIKKAKESLKKIGELLVKNTEKEVDILEKEIVQYLENMNNEQNGRRDWLKTCLETLTTIRNLTMDTEFRISDVVEKFRIIKKYKDINGALLIEYDEVKYNTAKELQNEWTRLLTEVKKKDESLKQSKLAYKNQHDSEVSKLKERISKAYEEFEATGPKAIETSLNDGLQKMDKYKALIKSLDQDKQKIVRDQKIFNFDITNYPYLIKMIEDMKQMKEPYEFYRKMKEMMDEWKKKAWELIDYKELEEGKKFFQSEMRELKKKYETSHVYKKLKIVVDDFKSDLPLIRTLKENSYFDTNHWKRLLQSIEDADEHRDFDLDGIDFSSITLGQVFDMKLKNYPAEVNDVVNAAKNEYNNKMELKGIKEYWNKAELIIVEFRKRFKIKVSDDIKQDLDAHLNDLQGIEGNKFAGQKLKNEVGQWMKSLSLIQECLEMWIQVQTKWLYLEGIYIGNEDIRNQLRKAATTFEQHDKNFRKINEVASKSPNIYQNCVSNDTTITQLKNLSTSLDISQKKLKNYLELKKKIFPRFYFISDEDLLSILGSSDATSIQPQLIKLFDNCKALIFDNNGKFILGMVSDEGESFRFTEPFKPEGAVEQWMNVVEDNMRSTLRRITKSGIYHYAKLEKQDWIEKYPGMVCIVGCQIWWTWRVEDVFKKVAKGDKYAMKKESARETKELKKLISLVRSDLEAKDPKGRLRKKINTLIIIEVHARDIVDGFVRDSILDAREFEWESQLRFYWKNQINDITIEQCTGNFRYGYEYQGLNGRLVITQLTDRCVMTLTTALTFFLGGAPAGPAGTGKTETCKDLAKSLAIRCVVTNCGENFDATAMGNIFSGLCQTGFWGCFDEFNRILPEVLSVVSTQIGNIQRGLKDKKQIEMLEDQIDVKPTVGIFITMNPGNEDYEGRSELPDNLKALFRPVTMFVPDKIVICENMLMSEGFEEARMLAKKMTVLYNLSYEQLSKQYHYDFGLRALKSVLVMAGSLKRGSPDIEEERVLMKALKDMNMPKFVHEDVSLFLGLLADLFPGLKIDSQSQKEMQKKIKERMEEINLQKINDQVSKVIQLYETMGTRHATMVVGPTGSGKTTIIELLKEARTIEKVRKVQIYTMNPKAQDLLELYGVMDNQTRDWTDGILAHIFKKANADLPERAPNEKGPKEEIRWILFDGDVDAVWIENMNSVMDDNRLLTLSNGARHRLKPYCKLLFEVFDLQHASPATISRSGMVYVDPKNLGYEPYFMSWINKWKKKPEEKEKNENTEEIEEDDDLYGDDADGFESMYKKFVPPLINFIYEGKTSEDQTTEPLEMNLYRTPLNLVKQFCALMDALIPEDNPPVNDTELEFLFVFCSVWSFGSCLIEQDRDRFLQQLKLLSEAMLPIGNPLYDWLYNYDLKKWELWEKRVGTYLPPLDKSFHKILVPTVDTVKYSFLLKVLVDIREPVIFVGDPGTAKTIIIKNYLRSLDPEDYTKLDINFSSRTISMEVQKNIEGVTDKIRPLIWGPKLNKKLVVFVDELHMPKVDKYGTQQPIALLKFLIDKGIMYERGGKLQERHFQNTQFVAALLPPGGGYNKVDPRFLSLFSTINILFPNEINIKRIYNEILSNHIDVFEQEIKDSSKDITSMTLKLYQKIKIALPRSPVKFHYIFNLRDLSKIYQGLLLSDPEEFNDKGLFIKLWKHECERVFVDRLVTEEDREIVKSELIPDLIKDTFGDDVLKKSSEEPLLFGNFMLAEPTEPELMVEEIYQDLVSYEKVRAKCEEMLLQLEEEKMQDGGTTLVLFNDALAHIVRIIRILKMPRGHCMLVGVGGSGKRSLTRLVGFICGFQIFEIQLKKKYKESNFIEDLKILYLEKLVEKETLFLFSDAQIVEEGFLEFINTMLTVGVINALFDEATKAQLRNDMADACRKAKCGETPDEIWSFTIDKFKDNLHIVLAMSPAGDSLRLRCRNFPGLVSSTTIDWFFPWPESALTMVAEVTLENGNFEAEVLEKIIPHFVKVHKSIPQYAKDYEKNTRRKVYSTPKNYLDFLNCYMEELRNNKRSYKHDIKEYEQGLEKLKLSKKNVEVMSEKIAKEKITVSKRKNTVESLTRDVEENKRKAEIAQKKAIEKQAELEVQEVEIAKNLNEAETLKKEKEPELLAAQEEVKKISKSDLSKMATYNTVAKEIESVCFCLLLLRVNEKAKPPLQWSSCQGVLKGSLKDDLVNYDVDSAKSGWIKSCRSLVNKIDSALEKQGKEMTDKSEAASGLFKWVKSTLGYYETAKLMRKLTDNAERLKKEKEQSAKELKETKEDLVELESRLEKLNFELKTSRKELKQLEEDLKKMEENLRNGKQLIDGLGSEEKRWTIDKTDKEEKILLLEAECLLNASFLSYFGPFDQEFRQLMTQNFTEDILKQKLIIQEAFKVEDLLVTDVEISKWNSQGLPGDPISIQNGILTTRASRYPFCIDPQLQAVTWIKKMEKDLNSRGFQESSLNNPKLTSQLEMCFKNGYSLLIENVNEELDPLLDPILLKDYVSDGSGHKVMIGDKAIDVTNPDFRLYMTSKLPNPNLSPEIMGKTSVINYTVNMDGLKQQLLNEVVGYENEEQETLRKKLIMDMSKNKKILKDSEQKLLFELANTAGPILENTELIQQLQESKATAKQMEEDLAQGEITQKVIEESRLAYQDVAKRGAILFFAMKKLSAISEMYEYSLRTYLNVFRRSLVEAPIDNLIITRIKNIIDKLTQNIAEYITVGIFEKHRRVFRLQMTLMIMEGEGELNNEELDFFLKGNTSLDEVERSNPFDWVTDPAWKDLEKLKTLSDNWRDFLISLEDEEYKWKEWYDYDTPEEHELPEPFNKSISPFQLLLILRVLRPDRVSRGIDKFILAYFKGNGRYIEKKTADSEFILSQANERIPTIYILSPGADPSQSVRAMSEKLGSEKTKFLSLSLGQNMEKKAEEMVINGSQRGYWVLLQNCDLLPAWLSDLEKILEEMERVNVDFRLWLTTRPTKKFPLGILQNSTKIVEEPPEGIKKNMQEIITKVDDKSFKASKHHAFKPLTYVLTFLHAVLIDRTKYGKIGWNVEYDFSYSDFKISFELLQLYLNKSLVNKEDTIPWGSLKYLIGEAMYGGRVTDEYDRRVLMTYLNEYMGDFLFESKKSFVFAKTPSHGKYKLESYEDKETLQKVLKGLNSSDSPTVFGLHPNAEITYLTNDAKLLWTNFLLMQSVGSSGGSNLENAQYISGIADEILGKTQFDEDVAKLRVETIEKSKSKTLTPSQVVLFQEMERFKILSNTIQVSLMNLKRALSGKIGMSAKLDELSVSLFNGFLPNQWRGLAPKTQKKLGSWIKHYEKRKQQYRGWLRVEPAVMWLSGLHIPGSYLTALVQAACRLKGWALDKSTLFTTVTDIHDISQIEEKPEFGCYVTGLYLEGVSWDVENNCINKQEQKELIYEMPVIKINPVEVNKLKLKDSIKVPVYVTQNRCDAAGVGHVFDADLNTTEHPSHWILQGICMVLNTDQ